MSLLQSRKLSSFPLTVGTGLAFESLFEPTYERCDVDRIIPNKINILNYNELWINVHTLYRNMVGSIFTEQLLPSKGEYFAVEIMTEMEVINNLVKEASNGNCKVIYYICSYEKVLKAKEKITQIRKVNTDFQALMSNKLDEMKEYFHKKQKGLLFELDSDLIPSNSIKALILTHIPYDLLSSKKFYKLDLLESHTGVLKPKSMWYTKYYSIPRVNMSVFPFNRRLLKIFGDNVMFAPSDIRLRRQMAEIAQRGKWTVSTTDAKVLMDIHNYILEPYMGQLISLL